MNVDCYTDVIGGKDYETIFIDHYKKSELFFRGKSDALLVYEILAKTVSLYLIDY